VQAWLAESQLSMPLPACTSAPHHEEVPNRLTQFVNPRFISEGSHDSTLRGIDEMTVDLQRHPSVAGIIWRWNMLGIMDDWID
jgi:hypothetical protein